MKDRIIEGERASVILVHGFTGTPSEMEYVGSELNRREGWRVVIPCLPGHCTTPYDLEKIERSQWIRKVESVYIEEREKIEKVFIAGLSMGGLITLNLAMKYRSIPAIVTISIPMKLKNRVTDSFLKFLAVSGIKPPYHHEKKERDIHFPPPDLEFDDYRWMPLSAVVELYRLILETKLHLNYVTNPVQIFHSLKDNTAHPESAKIIYNRVSSKVKELVYFHDSYHVIPLDIDRECLIRKMINFFKRFL